MAAKTWTGLGLDELWSNGLNWNLGTVPATTDTITFDGTSVKNCTIDALGTWSGGTFTVNSTYTGDITQNVAITTAAFSLNGDGTGTNGWTQAANFVSTTWIIDGNAFFTISGARTFQCTTMALGYGTSDFGSASSMICTGNVLMTGTTPIGPATVHVVAPAGTWEMRDDFTCTYAAPPTDTYLDFDPNGGTINFTGATATLIDVPSFVIGFSYNLVTMNKSGQDITIAASNVVPIGASPTSVVRGLVVTGEITASGVWAHTGNITVNGELSGAVTEIRITPTGSGGNLTVGAAAAFPAGVDLVFLGSSGSSTLTSTVVTFGIVTINRTSGSWILAANTTANLGTDPTTNSGNGRMEINGTLQVAGEWTHLTSDSVVGLLIGAAGDITGALTDFNFGASITLTAGGTFPASVALHVSTQNHTTITMTGITFADSDFSGSSFNVTVAASTTVPLVSCSIGTGTLTINGTITGSCPLLCGPFTTGAGSFVTGAFSIVCTNGAFTMNATGTISSTASVTMNMLLGTARTFAGAGKTYASLSRTGAGTGTLTITGTNTFVNGIYDTQGSIAHTIVFPNVTTTVGTFRVNGSVGKLVTLTRTGGAGTFTLAKSTAGDVNQVHHISVSNSTVDASPIWYAGVTPPSVDGGGNTNWIFTAAPDEDKLRKSAVLV